MGLPGAGKTTAAQRAAELLGAPWHDLDSAIVSASGKSVREIFSELGEPNFRALERSAMDIALAQPQIIAAGGGWAAEPGGMEAAELRALIIYLSLSPEVAAARLHGATDRPLLSDAPHVERLTQLLAAREARYRLAGIEIAVGELSSERTAQAVASAARHYGGW
ncbi:MAG: shikimate kinase [Gemmatimonadota bacterium]